MAEYIERNAAIRALTLHDCDSAGAKIAIRNLPASDVAPVVHGRWAKRKVNGVNYRFCPVCDEYRPALNEFGKAAKTNYCPNCGAKMNIDKDGPIENTNMQ